MFYPSDDLDTPPQPRFMDDSVDDPQITNAGTPVNANNIHNNNNNINRDVDDDDEDDDDEEDDDVGDDGTAQGGGGGVNGLNSSHGGGGAGGGGAQPPVLVVPAVSNLDSLYGLREIGREALCWQLSSAKPGNGVEQIRDHSTETYWQSDGTSQPHWIQVHFARRVAISHVCLYLDYNLDESYTPRRLSVQVGMTNHDLVPAIAPQNNNTNTLVEFQEPVGWCIVPLQAAPDPLEDMDEDDDDNNNDDEDEEKDDEDQDEEDRDSKRNKNKRPKRCVKAHLVQISILSQHQNGRDTHVRQVQLYGPRTNSAAALMKVHAQMDQETTATTTATTHNNYKQQQQSSSQKDAGNSSRLLLQRGRHWDQEFSTVTMSQFSTVR